MHMITLIYLKCMELTKKGLCKSGSRKTFELSLPEWLMSKVCALKWEIVRSIQVKCKIFLTHSGIRSSKKFFRTQVFRSYHI